MICSSNATKRRRQLTLNHKIHGSFPNDEAALKFLYLASAIVGPFAGGGSRMENRDWALPSCSANAASVLKLQSNETRSGTKI
jgi:transposase-like protein